MKFISRLIPSRDAATTSGLADTSNRVAPAREYTNEIFLPHFYLHYQST